MVVVIGCGAAPGECPYPTTAAAEMRVARKHGDRAGVAAGASKSHPHVWDRPYSGQTWFPWFYYWDPQLEHARLTSAGIEQAQALELEHRAACNDIPERSQARSPLDTYAIDAARVRDGVRVHVAAEVGPPDALLVALRCHRAWLRLRPGSLERDDVFALDGLKVVVHAGARDGVDVLLSSDDPALIGELDRRARAAVTRAHRVQAMQPR